MDREGIIDTAVDELIINLESSSTDNSSDSEGMEESSGLESDDDGLEGIQPLQSE